MSDSGAGTVSGGELHELFHWLIIEGVGVLFLLASFVFIIAAGIKLIRGKRIPGAKSIFISIVLTLPGAAVSVLYETYAEETNLYITAIIDTVLGVIFLVGAHGFWHLAKFAHHIRANQPLNATRADDARAG